ncbi:MAG: hypothetical protein AB2L11_11325 [Syntrophobacteraceae bacterium]
MNKIICYHLQVRSAVYGEYEAEEARLQKQLGCIQRKLPLMSNKGGVGKRSKVVRLSLGPAKRGRRVVVVDIGLHRPSI